MKNQVSINFKQFSDKSLLHHNDRKQKPDYLLDERHTFKNAIDENSYSKYLDLFNKAEEDMKAERKKKKGGMSKFRKDAHPLVDTVLSLGRDRTIELINQYGIETAQKMFSEQIEKLAKKIESEMGLTFVCANGHFDEGHYKAEDNSREFPLYNFHYHLSFLDYDFNEHKTVMRKYRKGNPIWSSLQDWTAEAFEPLSYVRGEKGSKAERQDAKDYKASMERLEDDLDGQLNELEEEVKGLSLDDISALKEKHKSNKIFKRVLDYAYRLKALEEVEAEAEKKQQQIDRLFKSIQKLIDGKDELSFDEAEFLKGLITEGIYKPTTKERQRVANALSKSPSPKM